MYNFSLIFILLSNSIPLDSFIISSSYFLSFASAFLHKLFTTSRNLTKISNLYVWHIHLTFCKNISKFLLILFFKQHYLEKTIKSLSSILNIFLIYSSFDLIKNFPIVFYFSYVSLISWLEIVNPNLFFLCFYENISDCNLFKLSIKCCLVIIGYL